MRLIIARWVSLVSYFSLLALIVIWHTWVAPPQGFPRAVLLLILAFPLLLPLRGLLYGKSYTHAWTIFLALAYFILGVAHAATETGRVLVGVLQIIFSLVLFAGCVDYVRLKAQPG